MFFADKAAHDFLEPYEHLELPIAAVAVAVFVAIAWLWRRRAQNAA
jgi:hypothetical protein